MASAQVPVIYPCDICEVEEDARWFCHECSQNLCDNCKHFHLKTTVSKNHTVVDISRKDIKEKNSTDAEVQCPSHKRETCKLVCNNCEIPVCTSCVITSHKNHEFSSIQDATEKVSKNLRELLDKKKREFEELSQANKVVLKVCDDYFDDLTKLEQTIKDRATEWKKMADTFQERSLKDLKNSQQTVQREKGNFDRKFESKKDKMEEEIEKCESALKQRQSYEVLNQIRKSLDAVKFELPKEPIYQKAIFAKKDVSERELYHIFGLPSSKNQDSKEVALLNTKANVMIYDKDTTKWKSAFSILGVSGIGIYKDNVNNKYRIVGREEKTGEVTINTPLYKGMKYEKATPTFIQYKSASQVYGLNFADKDKAGIFIQTLEETMAKINKD